MHNNPTSIENKFELVRKFHKSLYLCEANWRIDLTASDHFPVPCSKLENESISSQLPKKR